MHKSKILALILGLLLSFVTMAADNSIINDGAKVNLVGGTYTAKVIAPKAIVYSDENMLSPLGYIANGKNIIVGNPRRMNRDLVPLVVYGRIAFIEIKNIRYEDSSNEDYSVKRGAPREHNIDAIIEKPEEKLSINNSAFLTLHTYGASDEIRQVFETIDDTTESTMTGFDLQFIHRKELSRVIWGAALDYSGISSTTVKFNYWLVSPTLGYTPMRNKLFLIDLYGSFDLGINTVFDISSNYEDESSGWIWGPRLNARIAFFPESKYHAVGGIEFRSYNIRGIDSYKDANEVSHPGFSKTSSLGLFIGFGMEL